MADFAFGVGCGDEQMSRRAMEAEWSDGRYLQVILGSVSGLIGILLLGHVGGAATVEGLIERAAATAALGYGAKRGIVG